MSSNEKIALVTGGNRGIGLVTVRQMAKKGYRTILCSRRLDKGEEARESLGRLKDYVDVIKLDVTDEDRIAHLRREIEQTYGRLDILINNAGINYDTWQNPLNADLEEVLETLDTNLMGPWRMAQALVPVMQENAYGRIVNVSSGSGSLAEMDAGTPGYGVSKAALNALTIKLSKQLKGSGILVNAVCPGWVKTDMGGKNAPRSVEKGAEGIIWLAELPDDGPTGGFFRDKKPIDF